MGIWEALIEAHRPHGKTPMYDLRHYSHYLLASRRLHEKAIGIAIVPEQAHKLQLTPNMFNDFPTIVL